MANCRNIITDNDAHGQMHGIPLMAWCHRYRYLRELSQYGLRGVNMKTRFLLICVALASGSVPIRRVAAPPPARCAALAKFTVPGHTLQIDKAQNVPAGPGPRYTGPPGSGSLLPAHCRVDGVIDAHGPQWQALWHRFCAGTARRLEQALLLPGRWRPERRRQSSHRPAGYR
jgi:hypothetical protein